MLSKKVFLTGEPNFSAPPVHAARADVTSNHKKATTELRPRLPEACRSGGRQTLSFARFRDLLNFRLFRQHRSNDYAGSKEAPAAKQQAARPGAERPEA